MEACSSLSRETDRGAEENGFDDVIHRESADVKWSDVVGLKSAKEALWDILWEAIIAPEKFPHLYDGKRKPCRTVLLFGPPGTGKTFLAKAVAATGTEKTIPVFHMNASVLMSRWMHKGDELVKTLFNKAREERPSIVFIDDLSNIICRDNFGSDVGRRAKTELLVQMSEVTKNSEDVIVVATTYAPWDLETFIVRKFQRRLFIGLPNEPARVRLLKKHLSSTAHDLTEEQFKELGRLTEYFTGSDIITLVKDAAMQPLRNLSHFKRVRAPSHDDPTVIVDDMYVPCKPDDPDSIEMSLSDIPGDRLAAPVVTFSDFLESLKTVHRSVRIADIDRYREWNANCSDAVFKAGIKVFDDDDSRDVEEYMKDKKEPEGEYEKEEVEEEEQTGKEPESVDEPEGDGDKTEEAEEESDESASPVISPEESSSHGADNSSEKSVKPKGNKDSIIKWCRTTEVVTLVLLSLLAYFILFIIYLVVISHFNFTN